MKTLHFSIIIGMGIAMIVIGNSNLSFAQEIITGTGQETYRIADSPPLKQIDNGIPTENITCSSGLELIYKASNKYPACVKPQTAEKLIQRGWGILQPINYLVKIDRFLIPYDIIGGNMLGVKADIQSKSVIFSTHTTSSGVLYVKIPRALMDPKLANGTDDQFVILADGKETAFTETKTVTDRTLSIPFSSGINEIELIGTQIT